MDNFVRFSVAVIILLILGCFMRLLDDRAFKEGVFYGCLASVKLTEAGKPFEYQDIENLAIELREQK